MKEVKCNIKDKGIFEKRIVKKNEEEPLFQLSSMTNLSQEQLIQNINFLINYYHDHDYVSEDISPVEFLLNFFNSTFCNDLQIRSKISQLLISLLNSAYISERINIASVCEYILPIIPFSHSLKIIKKLAFNSNSFQEVLFENDFLSLLNSFLSDNDINIIEESLSCFGSFGINSKIAVFILQKFGDKILEISLLNSNKEIYKAGLSTLGIFIFYNNSWREYTISHQAFDLFVRKLPTNPHPISTFSFFENLFDIEDSISIRTRNSLIQSFERSNFFMPILFYFDSFISSTFLSGKIFEKGRLKPSFSKCLKALILFIYFSPYEVSFHFFPPSLFNQEMSSQSQAIISNLFTLYNHPDSPFQTKTLAARCIFAIAGQMPFLDNSEKTISIFRYLESIGLFDILTEEIEIDNRAVSDELYSILHTLQGLFELNPDLSSWQDWMYSDEIISGLENYGQNDPDYLVLLGRSGFLKYEDLPEKMERKYKSQLSMLDS